MRAKILGCNGFFVGLGSNPAANRICFLSFCLCASHSASVRYTGIVKWVSVLGIFVLRLSCKGTCAQAQIAATSTEQTTQLAIDTLVRTISRSTGAVPEKSDPASY